MTRFIDMILDIPNPANAQLMVAGLTWRATSVGATVTESFISPDGASVRASVHGDDRDALARLAGLLIARPIPGTPEDLKPRLVL